MNYYPFHIGDYASATRHLSWDEDAAYRRLLDAYYVREGALPLEMRQVYRLVMAQTPEQRVAVETVLREFFVETEQGWTHSRCEQELDAMRAKRAKAAQSANARWAKADAGQKDASASTEHANASRAACEGNAPNTNTNTNSNTPLPPKGGEPTVPCPIEKIIGLYHEILPELPAAKLRPAKRDKAIRAFWAWIFTSKKSDGTPRARDGDEALAWVRGYFERARQNDWLMGRTGRHGEHEKWECDIDFLLTDRGKKHVIEKTREAA